MTGNPRPLLIMLAGINGAGKTTFCEQYLSPLDLPFVNADLIAEARWPDDPMAHAYEAGEIASRLREEYLERGCSFVTETVFSHPSKVEFLDMAAARGFSTRLIYVFLADVGLAQLRIRERVEAGGHDVPREKVVKRFPGARNNLLRAIERVESCRIYDNSELRLFQHVLTTEKAKLVHVDWGLVSRRPALEELVSDIRSRLGA